MKHPYPVRVAGDVLPASVTDRIRPVWNELFNGYVRAKHSIVQSTLSFEYAGRSHSITATTEAAPSFSGSVASTTTEGVPLSVLDVDVDRVFDVGAYHGLYTTLLAELNPRTPVTAFEPEDKNRSVLRNVIDANEYDNVAVREEVVTDTNGTVAFYVNPNGGEGNSVRPSESLQRRERRCVRLSSELDGVDSAFCKIDAEGAEYAVLRDVLECTDTIVSGIVELHPDKLTVPVSDVLALLDRHSTVTFIADSSPRHPDADSIHHEYNRPMYHFAQ